jgi:hypothetical protein
MASCGPAVLAKFALHCLAERPPPGVGSRKPQPLPARLGRGAEVAPKVSNELSNYCGANRQPRLDDPGSFGAPGTLIDDHLACFTPKRSRAADVHPRPVVGQVTSGCSAALLYRN